MKSNYLNFIFRFKSPEPIKKWKEIYYANKEGNACPQPVNGKVDGKEDCLYLNVFTPKLKFNELMVSFIKIKKL